MKFPLMGRWAGERRPQTAIGLRLFLPRMQGRGDHFVFQQRPEGAICSPVARRGLSQSHGCRFLGWAASATTTTTQTTWSPVATQRGAVVTAVTEPVGVACRNA